MQNRVVIDGRFDLFERVASGGMGTVYRALDRLSGQPVAVKLVNLNGGVAVERFLREASLMAELQHPGIVRYVAHGRTEAGPYLAMEWLEGVDLARFLRRGVPAAERVAIEVHREMARLECTRVDGPGSAQTLESPAPPPLPAPCRVRLPVEDVLTIGRRAASALAELHRRGIVHRDVKPSNLFLSESSPHHVKLLDFGTARFVAEPGVLTAAGVLVGTPSYMSPEQAVGRDDLKPCVDVWGLGCVLYEALAGRPPFEGSHTLAVLARIVMDEPEDLATIRPDVPAELLQTVRRMLQKREELRFADGSAVHEALSPPVVGWISEPHDGSGVIRTFASPPPVSTPRRLSRPSLGLTTVEARVLSLLLARGRTLVAPDVLERLSIALARHGCSLQPLADGFGSLLVTSTHARAPKDHAVNLARAAIFLRDELSDTVLVLATGRGQSDGVVPVGEVLDHAVVSALDLPPGAIGLDELSAALLEGRFEVHASERGPRLGREREAEGTRTLLGRPTLWVGRQRELAMLSATFDDCVGESAPRAVVVTAPPGIGKTRLRHEFLRSLEAERRDFGVLLAQGDALSAGSPFAMIGPAIRRAAGVLDGEPIERRRQKLVARVTRHANDQERLRAAPFLGELVGIPFPDEDNASLRAARKDPILLGDWMRKSLVSWLSAECSARPLVVVLEDLHWGDQPSVQYLDAVMQALPEAPLLVLALARPEVHELFPGIWGKRNVQELKLHQLSPGASERLVRHALGDGVDEVTVKTIVTKGAGNAFYLEELVRFAADGKLLSVPETVLGMVQARLHALDAEARRVLRAGAIFGEVFWRAGAQALVGGETGAFALDEWLGELCRQELVVERHPSRLPGQHEFKFRHALVRDAAYEMLTAEDRELGHRLAGEWLRDAGEQDPRVLAEHFARGGDGPQAVVWFQRAAEQAFDGNDLDAVLACVERALAAGADGDSLGVLRALQSHAAYWKSEYHAAKLHGEQALATLPEGSAGWYRAAGSTLVSSARTGDTGAVDSLFSQVLAVGCHDSAAEAQLICLCRGTFQLIFNAQFDKADRALERIAALSKARPGLDALTSAQVRHVQGVRAAHAGDVRTFLGHLEAAVAGFELAGDVRNVCLERTTVAWCHAELGDLRRAVDLCTENLAYCQGLGAPQAVTYAKVNLGYILSLVPAQAADARSLLLQAIEECGAVNNLRLEGWARAHLANLEHHAGSPDTELRHAEVASDRLAASPGLQAWALATLARALLRQGRAAEALLPAERAMQLLEQLGGLLQGESLPPLALASVRAALGDRARAAETIRDARLRLVRRAARLEARHRDGFLALPLNAETARLGDEVDGCASPPAPTASTLP
jgi:serine/threonine protein kinase/tetratricopeptide (TPR) repeat protein